MFDWLSGAGSGLVLGGLGFVTGIASLVYARSQARGAHAQVQGAREQALEALRAAGLVAESAREQAAEALRAAGLVAESARQQAADALVAADLLASSAVSARVREMRARNLRSNPNLPPDIQEVIQRAGGADAYSVVLDAIDIAQEVYFLRKRGLVSDENWRHWIDDQMALVARSPSFEDVFRRDAAEGELFAEFATAFEPVFQGRLMVDPGRPAHGAASNNGATVRKQGDVLPQVLRSDRRTDR